MINIVPTTYITVSDIRIRAKAGSAIFITLNISKTKIMHYITEEINASEAIKKSLTIYYYPY